MTGQPKKVLRMFYDQALLSPELLCLYCGNTDWSSARGRCSDKKRRDCLLFVSDMVEFLAQASRPPAPSGRRPPASLP